VVTFSDSAAYLAFIFIHFASIGESTRLRRNLLSSIGNKIGTADTLTACEVVYEIAFGVRAGYHNNPLRRY